jgi:uncharacterized membrane protein
MTIQEQPETRATLARLGRDRHLHRLIPLIDGSGKVIQRVVKPLMVELRARDLIQILVGSSLLAIPAAYTEETWNLGANLAWPNVLMLATLSIAFMAAFVYYNFYRNYLREFAGEYVKRVIAIYVLSALVVGVLLTVIGKCPWGVDDAVALKRILVVTFPASMSAAITDFLK